MGKLTKAQRRMLTHLDAMEAAAKAANDGAAKWLT
jgi:hypothetical protein